MLLPNHELYSHVCQMRDTDRLTFRSIGARLGISYQAAWQLYQRAMRPPRLQRSKRYQ